MCDTWKREAKKLREELTIAEAKIAELESAPWSPYPPVGGLERISSQGWIDPADIEVKPQVVTITTSNVVGLVLPNTNSMEGWMDDGHTIFIERAIDRNKLAVGDVVAINLGDRWLIHQIINITPDGEVFQTQGVNCSIPDPYLTKKENIIGVLVAVIYTKKKAS